MGGLSLPSTPGIQQPPGDVLGHTSHSGAAPSILSQMWFPRLYPTLSLSPSLQRWLAESARLIARTGSAVEWVTPLGIPVIQPYHQDAKVLVSVTPALPCPTPPQSRACLTPPARPIIILQINGGIQSLTFSNSGDTSQ